MMDGDWHNLNGRTKANSAAAKSAPDANVTLAIAYLLLLLLLSAATREARPAGQRSRQLKLLPTVGPPENDHRSDSSGAISNGARHEIYLFRRSNDVGRRRHLEFWPLRRRTSDTQTLADRRASWPAHRGAHESRARSPKCLVARRHFCSTFRFPAGQRQGRFAMM